MSSTRAPILAALWLFAFTLSSQASASRSELEGAVSALGKDHDVALAAVHLLRKRGAPAARAIREAWVSLPALAKKRAVHALQPLAKEHDAAIEALLDAARSDDARLRALSLDALENAGRRGHEALLTLVPDPRVGSSAALHLARAAPDFALEPLLDALNAGGGEDRPVLRDALATAVGRAKAPHLSFHAWLDDDPRAAATASAAFALRETAVRSELVVQLLEHAIRGVDGFATRWRLLQSAGTAGPSEPIDRWVRQQLLEAGPWMLRAAAVDAVAKRGQRAQARASLSDPYPRVRARAAASLEGDPVSLLERAALARRDRWPMVRAAAVRSLRHESDAQSVLVAAVDDSMSLVRAAAIRALIDAPNDEGWNRIHRRMRDRDEWPEVTSAAIQYAAAHCRADAAESLFSIVRRAAGAYVLTDDLNNAARAIEALRRLGTPEALTVVERLGNTPGVPPTLKMALERPLRPDERCGQSGS